MSATSAVAPVPVPVPNANGDAPELARASTSIVRRLTKRISFSRDKSSPTPNGEKESNMKVANNPELDAVTEKGESKFLHTDQPGVEPVGTPNGSDDLPAAPTATTDTSLHAPSIPEPVVAVDSDRQNHHSKPPGVVGRFKRRLSFLRERGPKQEEGKVGKVDVLGEKGETKSFHADAVALALPESSAPAASSVPASTTDPAPGSSTSPTDGTDPDLTTIPTPYPSTPAALAAAPSTLDAAQRIQAAVARVPWLPGHVLSPAEEKRAVRAVERAVHAELGGWGNRAKEGVIDSMSTATTNNATDGHDTRAEDALKAVRRDPKTGRPLPPRSVVPAEVDDDALISLLQCVPYMNGAILPATKPTKNKKALPNLRLRITKTQAKQQQDDVDKGVITALEGLAVFPWTDVESTTSTAEEGSAAEVAEMIEAIDTTPEDIYSRVRGGGLMLYAPLQPGADDKVELAEIKTVASSSSAPAAVVVEAVGSGREETLVIEVDEDGDLKTKIAKEMKELWSVWPWKKKGGAVADVLPSAGDPSSTTGPATTEPVGTPTATTPADVPSSTPTAPASTPSTPIPATVPSTSPAISPSGTDPESGSPAPNTSMTTTWVPSTTKLSFEALWWGFKLYLPPDVVNTLSADEVDAVKFTTMVTDALTWLFDHIPVEDIPPTLQPAFLVLQRVAPLISYIGTFISWSWSEIQSYNQGYGVILTATWLLPVVLIPSTWLAADWPDSPPSTPTSATSPTTPTPPAASGSSTVPPTTTDPPGTATAGTNESIDTPDTSVVEAVNGSPEPLSPVGKKVWRW